MYYSTFIVLNFDKNSGKWGRNELYLEHTQNDTQNST